MGFLRVTCVEWFLRSMENMVLSYVVRWISYDRRIGVTFVWRKLIRFILIICSFLFFFLRGRTRLWADRVIGLKFLLGLFRYVLGGNVYYCLVLVFWLNNFVRCCSRVPETTNAVSPFRSTWVFVVQWFFFIFFFLIFVLSVYSHVWCTSKSKMSVFLIKFYGLFKFFGQ